MVAAADIPNPRTLVTGAARGIGLAIAERLSTDGHRVALVDRDDAGPLAERIGGIALQADLAEPGEIRRAVADAIDQLGGIDVIVNNAGVFRIAPILDETVDGWDTALAINARAMLVVMQTAVPTMIEQGDGGRIINMASMGAKAAEAGQASYAASKAAVVALSQAAAAEFGPYGITVNSVCPGYVLTEMGADTRTPEQVTAWSAKSPLGRCAEVGDVANMVAFLASSEASYLTAQSINVNGGMVAH